MMAVLVLMFGSAPASAGGTVHFDFPQSCILRAGLVFICSSSSGQYTTTTTPSGITSLVGKGTRTFSQSSPSRSISETSEYKFNTVLIQGETVLNRSMYTTTVKLDGQTCIYSDNYLFANGEIRHAEPTVKCP
jgi:hypothetical protein